MATIQQRKFIYCAPLQSCPKFIIYLMQTAEASNLQLNAHCIKMQNMKLPQFFLYFCMRFNNNLLFGKQIINQSFFFRYVQKTV